MVGWLLGLCGCTICATVVSLCTFSIFNVPLEAKKLKVHACFRREVQIVRYNIWDGGQTGMVQEHEVKVFSQDDETENIQV